MAHTYSNLLTHVVFSTKDRQPFIDASLKPDLLAYVGGIVRELKGEEMTAKTMPDHIHLLLWLPPTVAVADVLRVVKTNSSRWVHQTRSGHRGFAWQTGYGAFSTSQSNAAVVAKYVRDQETHHRRISFQEEFIALLKKHKIAYDEHYLWD